MTTVFDDMIKKSIQEVDDINLPGTPQEILKYVYWYIEKHEFSPSQIIDVFRMNGGWHAFNKTEELVYNEKAKECLDFWRQHFIMRRLRGEFVHTPWQKGMIDLVKNDNELVPLSELKLVVTMPRFTDEQKRWNNYYDTYSSVHNDLLHPQRTFDDGIDLTFVESYMYYRNKPVRKRYVFVSSDNELHVYDAEPTEEVFIEAFLNQNNNKLSNAHFQCSVRKHGSHLEDAFKYANILRFSKINVKDKYHNT